MEHAVRDEIVRFVLASPENRHKEGEGRYFDEPLVGFASAEDPLFAEYKRIICGSVITDLVLPSTIRSATDHRGNCLYYRDGSCGICIDRCPAGALSRQGHDKPKCGEYVHGEIPRAVGERFQVSELGCGLCQTMVPCEGMIPRGKGQALTSRP